MKRKEKKKEKLTTSKKDKKSSISSRMRKQTSNATPRLETTAEGDEIFDDLNTFRSYQKSSIYIDDGETEVENLARR